MVEIPPDGWSLLKTGEEYMETRLFMTRSQLVFGDVNTFRLFYQVACYGR